MSLADEVNAGQVGEVAIYCDDDGTTHRADYRGETYEARLASARRYLADHGWRITDYEDLCPDCK